jgi:hypothetical protein
LPAAVTWTENVVVCPLTVRTTFAVDPAVKATLYWLRERVRQGIQLDSWRITVPLKLLLAIVICVVLDTPVAIVRDGGVAWIVKSGGGLAETRMVTGCESVPVVAEKVPVTITW